jgi:ParB family chromosome partitioning protein
MQTQTMPPPATKPIPNQPHDSRQLAIELIRLSPLNPRKGNAFDAREHAELTELAESIRQNGILQPIVVRPVQMPDGEVFEIIAGERRYRAADLVGLQTVPVIVRHATDTEVLLLALTENRHRRNVHALDEAEALAQLRTLDPALTVQGLAFTLGVSPTWVYNHFKLLALSDAAKDAYRWNAITAGHAEALSRVPADRQAAALRACFAEVLFDDAASRAEEATPDVTVPHTIDEAIELGHWRLLGEALVSEAELKRWIARHSTVDLSDELVQEAMPELADAIEDAKAEEERLLQVSAQQYPPLSAGEAKNLGVVRWGRWIEIDIEASESSTTVSADRCEAMERAVISHPADQTPRVIYACVKRGCPVHRPSAAATSDPARDEEIRKENERREKAFAKQQADAKAWKETQRPAYLAALAARVSRERLTANFVTEFLGMNQVKQVGRDFNLPLSDKTALAVLLLALLPVNPNVDDPRLVKFGKVFDLTPAEFLRTQKSAKPGAKGGK